MDNLTAESAAVRLYAAMHDIPTEIALHEIKHCGHLTPDILNVAAEHDRLCSERIAAAVKAARVEGLMIACSAAREEYLEDDDEPNRDETDLAYDSGITHVVDSISAIITAAENRGGENVDC